MVGSLAVVYGAGLDGLGQVINDRFTPLSSLAFVIMTLIYVPCVATVAAIKKETGSWRLTAFVVLYTLVVGWVAAVATYQLGSLVGGG